ncbi:Fe-S cluster assembly ATPase SufC [candidate division WWE3 bacterium]|jgi:Fe-S cluster assembly ATP-binding protein|nr:Fe-S cluster assembly ATPase SufC [candidate division WWE3 bacterium]MBT7350239.1 Fe-S cluster assembly ATPase SufC [candidate division WWE3 bacterium]
MLTIKGLKVDIDEKEILKGIDLDLEDNKVHVLMGPNGSGKSTLAQALMGHPEYVVTEGSVFLDNETLLELSPDERSIAGLFLSFQYPSEVPGVTISNFLRMVYNKRHEENLSPVRFRKILKEKMGLLDMDESFMHRYLNEGFSGGEKKRMEILQMLVLEPKFVILDETDSGLDIDALQVVSRGLNTLKEKTGMGVLVITHYTRILNYVEPDFVHVMKDGLIVKSGGKDLAEELEDQGYAPFGE